MTHQQLVDRSIRWLAGTKGCILVLSGMASTREVPDAIGWSPNWKQRGSILVECKTTIPDLLHDKRKGHALRIGTFRYFFVADDLVDEAYIEKHFPDHGLAILRKDRVYEVRPAPERQNQNWAAEVTLLVYAYINGKDNLGPTVRIGPDWNVLMGQTTQEQI